MPFKCQSKEIQTTPKGSKQTGGTSSSVKQVDKKDATSTGLAAMVLRYIPKYQSKDGESPFTACSTPKNIIKANDKRNKINSIVFRENGVLSVHKANYNKLTTTPLPSFVASSKRLLQEESDLPKVCISDRFDLNAYKLMRSSGYDFSKLPSLGHVIEVKALWA